MKNICHDTLLFDGNGGSARNGGGVRQSGRDPRELPLAMYAVKNMWPVLSEELGINVEYHKEGNLRLGKTARHMEILQGLTDRATACGLDVKMIDGKEVREKFRRKAVTRSIAF